MGWLQVVPAFSFTTSLHTEGMAGQRANTAAGADRGIRPHQDHVLSWVACVSMWCAHGVLGQPDVGAAGGLGASLSGVCVCVCVFVLGAAACM
jgi:hypothetical protein